jgi:hypothetical protein
MSDVTRVEIEVAACPTPYYHETHRYCPSCPWTEGPLEPPTARELLEEWEAASEVGWSRSLSVGEARIVLAALAEAERERGRLREALDAAEDVARAALSWAPVGTKVTLKRRLADARTMLISDIREALDSPGAGTDG